MTLKVSGDIRLAQNYTRPDDADAAAYIAAVEAVDGQPLETEVRMAINTFVKGCKADGIWDAIKASCILSGARTLQGALQPLVGTAPTSFAFTSADYNRKTGLVGDGASKYLNANFVSTSVDRDNHHMSAWMSSQISGFAIGASPSDSASTMDGLAPGAAANSFRFRSRYSTANSIETDFGNRTILGFIGASRNSQSGFTARTANTNTSITYAAQAQAANQTFIYRRPNTSSPLWSSSRVAFYSLGEHLDLALLDARVTDLINKFAEVIP